MKTIQRILEEVDNLDDLVEDGLPNQIERYLGNLTTYELENLKDFLTESLVEKEKPLPSMAVAYKEKQKICTKRVMKTILPRGVYIQYLLSPKKNAYEIARGVQRWKPCTIVFNIPEKIAVLKPLLSNEAHKNNLMLKQVSDKEWVLYLEGSEVLKSEGVSWNQLAGETLAEILQNS